MWFKIFKNKIERNFINQLIMLVTFRKLGMNCVRFVRYKLMDWMVITTMLWMLELLRRFRGLLEEREKFFFGL
jgi:hypothetical protein